MGVSFKITYMRWLKLNRIIFSMYDNINMKIVMNNTDKTKKELINELSELHQSYNIIREQHDNEISLLKLVEKKVSKSEVPSLL